MLKEELWCQAVWNGDMTNKKWFPYIIGWKGKRYLKILKKTCAMWQHYHSAVITYKLLVLGSPTCPILNLPSLLAFAAPPENHSVGIVQPCHVLSKLWLNLVGLCVGIIVTSWEFYFI